MRIASMSPRKPRLRIRDHPPCGLIMYFGFLPMHSPLRRALFVALPRRRAEQGPRLGPKANRLVHIIPGTLPESTSNLTGLLRLTKFSPVQPGGGLAWRAQSVRRW